MELDQSILEQVFRRHVNASEEEFAFALTIPKKEVYTKGDHFLTPEVVCDKVGFIEKGMAMIYRLEPEKKKSVMEFYAEGEYITDFYSYIKQQNCLFHIDFLEDSEVFVYERSQMVNTFAQSLHWQKYGRYVSESAYVKIMQQVYDTKFYTLEERYLRLIEDRSELFQRAPLYLIASYLNTTPETISRIRRSLHANSK